MQFADRIKELRRERGITQAQLGAALGISTGTVAMWETGKRKPGFDILEDLSHYFDRRIDYILGHADDASSPKITEEQKEQLGIWESENSFYETFMAYLRLDEYGKHAVESIIRAESIRCRDQESLFPESDFSISIRLRRK